MEESLFYFLFYFEVNPMVQFQTPFSKQRNQQNIKICHVEFT
jgi:hypothetical protein